MPFSLTKWSLLHAALCIAAVGVVFVMHSPLPLCFAGCISFGFFTLMGRPLWTPNGRFGPANQITLARFLLALSLFFTGAPASSGPIVFVTALAVLLLDGLDGWAARRRNQASEFGEYFDKETDAYFLLTLCLIAYFQQKTGAWIVIPGLLRYIFVIALAVAKPDVGKEYRSRWARIIYVTMVVALLAVFVTPAWFYNPLLAAGTTGLFLSFAHYFRWLFSGNGSNGQGSGMKEPPGRTLLKAILAALFLNSLLLIPSFIGNFDSSDFFPIPDPSRPMSALTWTRGWYDYVLYFFIRRPNQDIFRICADMVLLVTLLIWWNKKRPGNPDKFRFFTVFFLGLLLYEIYDAIVFQFFHRHGILYEDLQYILNLYYLGIDAFSTRHLFRLILIMTGMVLFTWWLPVLFRTIIRGLSLPEVQKWGLRFNLLFWPLFIGAWFWFGSRDERPTVRSVTGKIATNVVESVNLARTIEAIEQLPVDEIYNDFDRFTLEDRPNIYLVMIESYGRILRDDAYLRPSYDSLMFYYKNRFKERGWHSATRYSTAPVSGGLSWLSMNSVLSGLFIRNRTFYTRYLSRIHRYPHLVRFLKQQGYYTLTLQPPNRARLGLPVENHYDFDKTIYFEDLHYEGKPYSIWVIPDQYSLGYTHENYLPAVTGEPYFLFFETATTHAPWTDLPPYLSDWRNLNEKSKKIKKEAQRNSTGKLVENSFNNRFNNKTPQAPDLYLESITYDLKLICDYILDRAPENSLFIIVGDHQPPLLQSKNFDTPIHVITKNAALIERFDAYGFARGMISQWGSPGPLTHAGIYSMLIDVLTHDAERSPDLPSSLYRPEGIAPSVLTTSD